MLAQASEIRAGANEVRDGAADLRHRRADIVGFMVGLSTEIFREPRRIPGRSAITQQLVSPSYPRSNPR